MSPATTTPARPSDAYLQVASVLTRLDDLCPRANTARSLRFLLKHRGYGSVDELATGIGVSRESLKNWQRTGIPTPERAWQIASFYASEPPCPAPAVLERAMAAAPIPGAAELFDALYSDNERDAFTWLLEHRAAHFH